MMTRSDGSTGAGAFTVRAPKMVEIGASVLGDANVVSRPATLRDVYQEAVARLLGQKSEAHNLSG